MKKYTLLDINTYPRREHFAYFSDMANPYAGVTVETDITELYDWCRKNEVPFSELSLLRGKGMQRGRRIQAAHKRRQNNRI